MFTNFYPTDTRSHLVQNIAASKKDAPSSGSSARQNKTPNIVLAHRSLIHLTRYLVSRSPHC